MDLVIPESHKSYTLEEIKTHNTYNDLWVIINQNVYDLTKFADFHPAGRNVLLEYAGQDVTKLYLQFHSETILPKYHAKFFVGVCSNPKKKLDIPVLKYKNAYGDGIPYGDPSNVQGYISPYYNDSHKKVRLAVREFLDREIRPFVDEWDLNKKIPLDKIKKIGEEGCFALMVGQPWPAQYYDKKEVCGVPIDKFDYFHEMIVIEEAAKYTSNGIMWAFGSLSIALPPIINNGSDYIKDKYVPGVLNGDKVISLAVTEPWAGSDVAGIKTTAVLSEDGKYYTVNGMKKFITSGAYADYFTTAVRTDENKYLGVSLLLIEKNMPGVKTRAMNMQGVWGSGTGFIVFENVKVPAENLIGDEGLAFIYIMKNFNHERFQVASQCLGSSRAIVEECMKYAHQRKAFGKKLIDQPVIRQKLAHMIKEVECLQAYLEQVVYNMQNATEKQDKVLAGAIGICKAHSTMVLEKIATEGVQIFGGNGYQRGGVAAKVERYYRDTKSLVLGGGSIEVLLDMAVRQAGNLMPKQKAKL